MFSKIVLVFINIENSYPIITIDELLDFGWTLGESAKAPQTCDFFVTQITIISFTDTLIAVKNTIHGKNTYLKKTNGTILKKTYTKE